MFPVCVTASSGYPRSFIIANSLAWSREPNAFLKSMYKKFMFWFVNLASSRAAKSSCSCLDVLLSSLNPSWLLCSI
jgi:hypothetical protein